MAGRRAPASRLAASSGPSVRRRDVDGRDRRRPRQVGGRDPGPRPSSPSRRRPRSRNRLARSMSLVDRDAASADALLTDLYLDALLADAVLGSFRDGLDAVDRELDPAARRAADRLRRDLARVHPSFRFEERLATRLAEAAVAMRLPVAAGAEGRVVPFRETEVPIDPGIRDAQRPSGTRDLSRP